MMHYKLSSIFVIILALQRLLNSVSQEQGTVTRLPDETVSVQADMSFVLFLTSNARACRMSVMNLQNVWTL